MCGIAGFTHKHWSPPEDRVREATDTLKHRGPDQQGIFPSSLFSLGAARLKIIDLDSGNQPIHAGDGNSGIVFNGEANGWFKAYDSKTGKELWKYNCGAGVNAPAVSYMVGDKQYIAVAAGGNTQLDFKRGNTVMVFALP